MNGLSILIYERETLDEVKVIASAEITALQVRDGLIRIVTVYSEVMNFPCSQYSMITVESNSFYK